MSSHIVEIPSVAVSDGLYIFAAMPGSRLLFVQRIEETCPCQPIVTLGGTTVQESINQSKISFHIVFRMPTGSPCEHPTPDEIADHRGVVQLGTFDREVFGENGRRDENTSLDIIPLTSKVHDESHFFRSADR
ncbi:hypothetical protein [Halorhabdus rudnickae]|uniref:hypothetical protein n=1 Tax=Halorhabdus rudnickae TaxID=1775544 RepID=UPI0010846963|nr:hypothetical protein [Halorhabdus rudnickae]